eukprot:gene11040-13515_t
MRENKGRGMKYLTIVACIALVAGGAFYAATYNAAHRERKEQTQPMRDAENAFYDAAGAKEGETEKVRTVCENFARDPAMNAEPVKSFLSKCRQFGFLSHPHGRNALEDEKNFDGSPDPEHK